MDAHRTALDLILTTADRQPAPRSPILLDGLFRELASARPIRPRPETETMIWSIWTAHDDAEAVEGMGRALRMMSARSFEVAERVLDRLVQHYPDWAEAWNKRATLYFMMDRDEESIADIVATLRLEPRHFGAISGFGQICLRQDDEAGALIAFEEALRLHPGLDGARAIVDKLSRKFGNTLE